MKWKYDCGERIMAAASVSDSLVVVPALNGVVAALSHNGREVWKFTARSAVNAPCLITRGMVFVGSLDTYIYALSASDGSVLWKHSIDARIKTAPVVINHKLLPAPAAGDGYVYAGGLRIDRKSTRLNSSQ